MVLRRNKFASTICQEDPTMRFSRSDPTPIIALRQGTCDCVLDVSRYQWQEVQRGGSVQLYKYILPRRWEKYNAPALLALPVPLGTLPHLPHLSRAAPSWLDWRILRSDHTSPTHLATTVISIPYRMPQYISQWQHHARLDTRTNMTTHFTYVDGHR